MNNTTRPITIPKVSPSITPNPIRRYAPDPNHCPQQRVRTTRRIRRVIEP